MCAAAGLVDLSVVALDGTKIAADASLARNRDADWIRREVAKLMAVTGRGRAAARRRPGRVGRAWSRSLRSPRRAVGSRGLQAALAVVEAEDAAAGRGGRRARRRRRPPQAEQGRQLTGRKPKGAARAALARAEIDHRVALRASGRDAGRARGEARRGRARAEAARARRPVPDPDEPRPPLDAGRDRACGGPRGSRARPRAAARRRTSPTPTAGS